MKINVFLNQMAKVLVHEEENEWVVLDLGARYLKGLFVRENTVTDVFSEKVKSSRVQSASELLKKQGLLYKSVKLSVKGADTLIRYVPFPKVEKNKLKDVFSYEVSKYLPFPQETAYFDVFILDENYSKNEFLVLLAVAKREFVDSLLKDFHAEKIHVKAITLNSIALLNLFSQTVSESSNAAIIDIGFSSTLLNLTKASIPYLSREVKIGVRNFIEHLSRGKQLGVEEAENLLIHSSEEAEVLKVGEEVFFELSSEIRNSFDYFEMNAGESIEKVYLAGGFSQIKGIQKGINSTLGVDTKVWPDKDILRQRYKKDVPFPSQMLGVGLGASV
ncbi:MAG: pilus assembly protein PilM [Candidatus Omnitrophota bacterium]|nr:MAG: pilus assembly protein PilM [Candidatus Omnitrophota bacterium]